MTEKNIYISYLRVIATVFVIIIHSSTGYLNRFDATGFDWNYANLLNAATRCAVPLFVIISGALLLHKEEEVNIFYKKRIPKLLYPFVFWSAIYIIYIITKADKWSSWSILQIIKFSKDRLIHGANAHLWYLYMIMGLYLAIPFLGKMLKLLSIKEIELFLVLWLASLVFLNKGLNTNLPKVDLTFFSGYVGYLILGYYLSIKDWKYSNVWMMILAYICLVAFVTWLTFHLSNTTGRYDPFAYYYLFPTNAVMAALVFITFKKLAGIRTDMPTWVKTIDNYSFGIYLVHIIPLNFVHPLISRYTSTFWVVPLATLSTLCLSIALIYVLRKIPYGKYVSG